MSEIKKERLADLIPVKKFSVDADLLLDLKASKLPQDESETEVMKVSDVELFLEKISHPTNLAKLVKAMAFGQKIDFEDILKWRVCKI